MFSNISDCTSIAQKGVKNSLFEPACLDFTWLCFTGGCSFLYSPISLWNMHLLEHALCPWNSVEHSKHNQKCRGVKRCLKVIKTRDNETPDCNDQCWVTLRHFAQKNKSGVFVTRLTFCATSISSVIVMNVFLFCVRQFYCLHEELQRNELNSSVPLSYQELYPNIKLSSGKSALKRILSGRV